MTLASIIAAWAILWILVAAAVMAAGRRRGWPLPATAAWLVTIGAFLAAQEDPLLLIQMASTRPSTTGFREGVLGLVHADRWRPRLRLANTGGVDRRLGGRPDGRRPGDACKAATTQQITAPVAAP